MKHLLILLICTIFSINIYSQETIILRNDTLKTELLGVWQTDNIVYTFTNDSLYIDEIGNEGDEYIYNISGIIITAKNQMIGTLRFIVNYVTECKLRLTIIDEDIADEETTFTLTKK